MSGVSDVVRVERAVRWRDDFCEGISLVRRETPSCVLVRYDEERRSEKKCNGAAVRPVAHCWPPSMEPCMSAPLASSGAEVASGPHGAHG